MAAYRDSETGPTLVHMRQTAAYPARLYVGLVLQVDESTTDRATVLDTLPTRDPWYRSNVRTVVVPAHQATGPCCARAMAQLLYRNEDYCLQIDAHMRFRPNFDVYLRQELQSCPHPARSILTTYPVGYQLPNQIPCEIRGTCLYPFAFDTTGMLRQKGRLMETRPVSPVQHSLFAAGFCFGPSAWIRDCPYDGSLHHLFFGEEVSMAIRLYTAGYDLYAPRDTVVYHLWSRAHRPAPAPRISEGLRTASLEKVQSQMRGEGLGKCVRTVQAWAEQVGVNLETNEVLKEMANEWESLNVDD
jgi:[Skp1-protein]-hydroxyproline N-acetylglucosaminyltransferase